MQMIQRCTLIYTPPNCTSPLLVSSFEFIIRESGSKYLLFATCEKLIGVACGKGNMGWLQLNRMTITRIWRTSEAIVKEMWASKSFSFSLLRNNRFLLKQYITASHASLYLSTNYRTTN